MVVLVLSLAGCDVLGGEPAGEAQAGSEPVARDGSESPEEPAAQGAVDRSRQFVGQVAVESTGAASFRWDGEQLMTLMRVGAPGEEVNLLSASFQNPVPLPADPAARFRWGFDLMDAYEDRPGDFALEPGGPGGVLLVWMRVKDPAKKAVFDASEVEYLEHFTELRQRCALMVGPGERTGRLHCPEVLNEAGEPASFTVTWREAAQ